MAVMSRGEILAILNKSAEVHKRINEEAQRLQRIQSGAEPEPAPTGNVVLPRPSLGPTQANR